MRLGSQGNRERQPDVYPLVPLRDVVIFPSMATAILVGRQPSVNAVERAIKTDKNIVVVTQRNASVNEPGRDDLFRVGTLVKVFHHLNLPDGMRYEGQFEKGKFNGTGTLLLPDGRTYKGSFAEGLFSGKGVLTFPNGDRYEGEFKSNKYHGVGVMTMTDGRKYVGQLENGRPHGEGSMTMADGRRLQGEFKNGKFVSKK